MSNEQFAPETRGVAVEVLATVGSGHDPLAREQGNTSGGRDLGRYRQARMNRAKLPTASRSLTSRRTH